MATDTLSRAFSALGDPIRRDIVARLAAGGDSTTTALAESYDLSFQAIAKHVRVLEDSGLVSRGRDAQRRPVHLQPEAFDVMTAWIERYRLLAEARYRRLDNLLETLDDEQSSSPTPTE